MTAPSHARTTSTWHCPTAPTTDAAIRTGAGAQAPVAACIRGPTTRKGMIQVRKILLAVAPATALCAAAAPGQAQAASCGGWRAYDLNGECAAISHVHPHRGRNRARGRHGATKWLKRADQRQYAHQG